MREFDEVLSSIMNWSPGDLAMGMSILERLQEILETIGADAEGAAFLISLKQRFEDLVKSDMTDQMEAKRQVLVKELSQRIEDSLVPETQSSGATDQGLIVIDDPDVLVSFVQEARDHLENIEEKILQLEDGIDAELVNTIFRSMHTIKGVSSFLDLGKIKEVSHSLESLLDRIRVGEIDITTGVIDGLLAGSDLLFKMVQELEAAIDGSSSGPIKLAPLSAEVGPLIEVISRLESGQDTVSNDPPAGVIVNEDSLVTAEMAAKFTAESSDLLDRAEASLLELEKDPENLEHISEAFRQIHTIKGNAGFFWFTDVERLCMEMESVLDSVRSRKQRVSNTLITGILALLDQIRQHLHRIGKGEIQPSFDQDDREEVQEPKPLGQLLVEMGLTTEEEVDKALDSQQKRLGELLMDQGAVSQKDLQSALKAQNKSLEGKESQSHRTQRKDIRVNTERLDLLFNLMGELITAEAMLLHNPEIQALELPEFEKAASYLSKITREMQGITMSIRMIPLDGLFSKMRRLVRDLSRKFKKSITLHISGEQTEMDRNVMEEISDPLVHIIRNAIDHGIENASDRKRAGKDDGGNVWLSARYEGNEIWIIVKDDGGGLQREKILDKARENGLIGSGDSLTDKEVWQLIFEPGFSTAVEVSEISGRGVGMDVVRRNVEKIRGKIDVISQPGEGSEFIMRIPLTLAIIDGITLRVGNITYSIPINDIRTFHKALNSQVTRTEGGHEVIRLRDTLYPVVKLSEFFHVSTGCSSVEDGIIVIAAANNQEIALLVDEILGYGQLVIKALPESMRDVRALSGCTILGNGDVSLIMDIAALVDSAFAQGAVNRE